MSVTFSIFLDKRRIISKTETYPIKLRVTYRRKSKEYETVHKLTEEDFNKIEAPRLSEFLQKVKDDLKEIKSMMALAIKKVSPFDFWVFNRDYIAPNKLFVKKKSKKPLAITADTGADTFDYSEYEKLFPIIKENHDEIGRISGVYCDYIKQLIREKRIGSATKYRDSYSVIKSFGGNMYFQHITVEWLRSFEGWMLGKGRSRATVGGILRHLRCIFNEANHKKIINKEMCYPFGRRKYQIPTGKKRKRSLELADIKKLYFSKPSCDSEAYAKALWFFMYFGNGMNPKDVVYLKYKNIDGEYFSFYRQKTDLTSRHDPALITVYINEDMRTTIERYGNKDRDPNNFVFPVLKEGMTPLEEYFAIPRFTRFINDWMKKIGKRHGIELAPTTIVTRHSFSTIMKRSGASTEFIQEALGHMDKKTTENYLGSFEQQVKKEFAQKLEAFKNDREELVENGIEIKL